jgi:hypothetical protein
VKRCTNSTYYEVVEGWTCQYERATGWDHGDFTGPATVWTWWAYRGSSLLGEGVARTLRAARAAARAVVMEREARGLTMADGWGLAVLHEKDRERLAFQYVEDPDGNGWGWAVLVGGYVRHEGTAPTLAEARKAAREAS